jgi:hypothetical protein
MIDRKSKSVLSVSREPCAPAPQQMSLFPEEKPGRNLEQMKIRTLLKACYKTADNNATGKQAG